MTHKLLKELSVKFGLGANDLLRIIATAPARYKVFTIPKRNGGSRIIAQPAREVKALQRYLLENMLKKFPVHQAATGYVVCKNIYENAEAHVNNRVILKLDFKDFFPSILVRDWERYAKSNRSNIRIDDIPIYSKILFWGVHSTVPKCLSIGAPTSPLLSNILLFELDMSLTQAAKKSNVTYTRYADDITASAMSLEQLMNFENSARSLVRGIKSPLLIFNDEKRGVYTMGQRRMVTGLVLTPTQTVSIGRDRKRLISSMLHHLSTGTLSKEGVGKLKGLLGFTIANEPAFITRMREKYGSDIVEIALKYQVPPKEHFVIIL